MVEQYRIDDDANRNTLSIFRAVGALFSKEAQKAYLSTLLFIGASTLLLCISTGAYWIFYFNYIPQIGLERVVHLQFGDGHPWGTAPLGPELVSLQAYDVSVRLELPRTPSNLAAGNFMLDLALLPYPPTTSPTVTGTDSSVTPMARSRRPAILTYSSPMVDTANKLSRLPLYVVGWQREAEILEVQMMEQIELPRGWRRSPNSLRLEVHSDEKMQIYSAKVKFKARFTGLRWIMYNWKISSFLVFSAMFWGVSMTSTGVAWLLFASFFSSDAKDREKEVKKEERDDNAPIIKEETDDETVDPLASIPGAKKEEGLEEQTKLSSHASEADDESDDVQEGQSASAHDEHRATGTGFESPGARRIQRRRSHFKEEGLSDY